MTITSPFRRLYLQVLIVVVAIVILWPQTVALAEHWHELPTLSAYWLFLAVIGWLAANVLGALVYVCLAPKRLPSNTTLITQFAAGFANRIVPSGFGALGLFTFYLSKRLRISKTEAAAIAGTNNLIGFIAFTLIMLGITIITFQPASILPTAKISPLVIIVGASTLVTAVVAVAASKTLRKWSRKATTQLKHFWRSLRKRPSKVLAALVLSMAITVTNLFILLACTKAIGIDLSLMQLAAVFTAGIAAIAISPTPNGLGTAEVALSSVLITSTAAENALAIVIAYRLITFWLPIIPGYIAFSYINAKKYI